MNIKSDTGKLYSLLAPCIPDDGRIKRRLILEDFYNSNEYRELAECDAFSQYFGEYFSFEAIDALDYESIAERKRVAGIIPIMITRLCGAIRYGNGWAMTKLDIPDFTSYDSVKKVLDSLNFAKVYLNDTNISEKDFMEIFTASKNDRTSEFYCIKRHIGEGL